MPYWDCTMDANLEYDDIPNSYLFTEHFTGNADGPVKTGPWHDWKLKRNVGKDGALMEATDVEHVLSRNHSRDIVAPTFTDFKYYLEGFHNAMHVYIGGYVGVLNTASKDPYFFLIHTFIDYIWWIFRAQQMEKGINPEHDYPNETSPGHEADHPMDGFPSRKNIEGYANHWNNDVYTYEMTPKWPNCGDSKWLRRHDKKKLCVAKTKHEAVEGYGHLKHNPKHTNLKHEDVYRKTRTPTRTTSNPNVIANNPIDQPTNEARGSNIEANNIDETNNSPDESTTDVNGKSYDDNATYSFGDQRHKRAATKVSFDQCHKPRCADDEGIQNTFEINGKSSVEWMYFPVQIIYQRPPGLHFQSVFKGDGKPNTEEDIYTYSAQTNHASARTVESRPIATVKFCPISTSGSSRVYVAAYGLSYGGKMSEYAIIDQRLKISAGMSYIPVKSSTRKDTKVILTAFDECGRLCTPLCKDAKESVYKPCSGVITLSKDCKTCGTTFSKAISTVWDNESGVRNVPSFSSDDVCLKFICDSKPIYPWDRI